MSTTIESAATRIQSNESGSSMQSAANSLSPPGVGGRGILANAHEAPKKPVKAVDKTFTSALKSAFIPQQAGKLAKTTGKPLGKSFERRQPLATKGHEGGEVLKRDPRGDNAPCGDGIVLSSEGEEWGDEVVTASSPSDTNSSMPSSAEGVYSNDSGWESAIRGRSDTGGTSSTSRSASQTSETSSNNPCSIKFAPLPSSGRLRRANSIAIGVAARSQLLHSQGSGRTYNSQDPAGWQAQMNARRYGGPQQDNESAQQSSTSDASQAQGLQYRQDDIVDLGEEIRKGALKAWRRVRRGSSTSNGSAPGSAPTGEKAGGGIEAVEEEEGQEGGTGEKTPKRSASPLRMMSATRGDEGQEEPEGSRTPRHSMQRRLSTGTFIGHNAFMEIEEKRKRESRGGGGEGEGEEEEGGELQREEDAQFAEALGRTHASRVAHRTGSERWHPGMKMHGDGHGKATRIDVVDGDDASDDFHEAPLASEGEGNDEEDQDTREAERMADEALAAHSKQAKAGAVEKMEKKQS